MAGDLLRRSWRVVAVYGVALAREKAPSWLPLASWPSFKSRDAVVVVLLSSSSAFPVALAQLRRVRVIAVVPLQPQQSFPQLRLLIAHSVEPSLTLASTEKPLSTPFFLAAGNLTVASALPWPARYGLPLTLKSFASASS